MLSGAYGAGSGRFDLWPGWCYAGLSLATLAASYLIASDTVRLRELSVSAAILLAAYSASAQSKDVAGAKDPALFNRMPHYTIIDYHESQFDGYDFTIKKGSNTAEQRVEGRKDGPWNNRFLGMVVRVQLILGFLCALNTHAGVVTTPSSQAPRSRAATAPRTSKRPGKPASASPAASGTSARCDRATPGSLHRPATTVIRAACSGSDTRPRSAPGAAYGPAGNRRTWSAAVAPTASPVCPRPSRRTAAHTCSRLTGTSPQKPSRCSSSDRTGRPASRTPAGRARSPASRCSSPDPMPLRDGASYSPALRSK